MPIFNIFRYSLTGNEPNYLDWEVKLVVVEY